MSWSSRASSVVHEGSRLASVAVARSQAALRPLTAGSDRRRHPIRPTAVVIDPFETPEQLRERGLPALYVGSLERFATCTGVAWIDDSTVVTAYLLTGSVSVYRAPMGPADSVRLPTDPLWTERSVFGGATPTMVAVDATRSFVAIPMSVSSATPAQVVVAAVDGTTGRVDLAGATVVPSSGDTNLHAVEFTPDGRSLIWSTIDTPTDCLRVAPLSPSGIPGVPPVAGAPVVIRDADPVAPVKGFTISPTGHVAAVARGVNASFGRRRVVPGRVETRVWLDGSLGPVISTVTAGLVCPEDVAFHPLGRLLAVVDQVTSQVHIFDVDPGSGVVAPQPRRVISWSAGGLSAPHACAFSPDGRWLAVGNYGDSSLRFFDVDGV